MSVSLCQLQQGGTAALGESPAGSPELAAGTSSHETGMEGPESSMSPTTWAWARLLAFTLVFLISASKKPLPPTPEDNRVSELQT